jgi:hypothetical protein
MGVGVAAADDDDDEEEDKECSNNLQQLCCNECHKNVKKKMNENKQNYKIITNCCCRHEGEEAQISIANFCSANFYIG